MREACKFNVQIHNENILKSSVTKDPGVSSILLFSGSGINFPHPLYFCITYNNMVKNSKSRPKNSHSCVPFNYFAHFNVVFMCRVAMESAFPAILPAMECARMAEFFATGTVRYKIS